MYEVERAGMRDLKSLCEFLEQANVSTEGLEESIEHYVLLLDHERRLAGTIGIEPLGSVGLLRSLVVKSEVKEEDILTLFQHVYNAAKIKKLSTLFLVTNKEQSILFFQWLGFEEIKRENLPPELEKSAVYNELKLLEKAAFMEKRLRSVTNGMVD